MKNIITLFGSTILGTTSIVPLISNFNNIEINSRDLNNIWNNVGISHSVTTPKTGTQERNDTKSANYATAKISWDEIISQSSYVNAHGYFALHTYTNAKYYDHVQLTYVESSKNSNVRTWIFSETHEDKQGWGHHTSKITLTLTATYNSDEGITALSLSSYIYARTAGAVHECSTTSKVDSIRFLIG